jgi:GNAT superfamily N-acetyltransferase
VILRPALRLDVPAMHALRVSVRENRLRDPSRVTQGDYIRHITQPGTSWVAEVDGSLAGFAIADLGSRSVWALFVAPEREGRGIGRALLRQVTSSLAAAGPGTIHLSTEQGTRAERLYVAAGWIRAGNLPNGEIHFVRVVPGAV